MKLQKAVKILGLETFTELHGMDNETLRNRVVQANEAIRQACDELEANEQYQEIKENKKALEAGRREVNARQNAIIAVVLSILNSDSQDAADILKLEGKS